MKKTFYFLLALTIGFTACNHEKDRQELSLPATTASMTRNLDFIMKGTKRDTIYTTADNILTGANYSTEDRGENRKTLFNISFDAGPHFNGTSGDFVLFQIDTLKLRPGFTGTYTLAVQDQYPLANIRYVYSTKGLTGGLSGSIVESGMGMPMVGSITITEYDPKNHLMSGSYSFSASLNNDPTRQNIIFDADDKCNLQVTGVFTNLRVKMN
jgi:hypothetical protein